jgi:hypothetical protein
LPPRGASRIASRRPITRPRRGSTPAAFSSAPAFTYGNAPRTITDLRSPGQYNVDGVFLKNFSFGTKQAQLKIEMLNLMNRPNVRALSARNNQSNTNFGQTGVPGRVHADHPGDVPLLVLGD